MWKNLRFTKDLTVKEWVAQIQELNRYLKDFPAHSANPTQPVDKDELLDILEFRVPASWCREFTVQGFNPVTKAYASLWSSVPVWSLVSQMRTSRRLEKLAKHGEESVRPKF
eukprot:4628206-Ditylum_brightwellii.AAC.1